MAVLNIDDTLFSKIQQVNFTTSGKISSDKYVIDENNNIVFNLILVIDLSKTFTISSNISVLINCKIRLLSKHFSS